MGSPSALPLGFGMLGGLVPVSLPFQFPPLLNFNPPGTPGATGMGSAPSSNSGYPLAQSDLMGELKFKQRSTVSDFWCTFKCLKTGTFFYNFNTLRYSLVKIHQ